VRSWRWLPPGGRDDRGLAGQTAARGRMAGWGVAPESRVSTAEIVETARALCPADEDILELGARGLPRWFFPVGDFRTLHESFALYPALRWRSRAYRAALRAWATAGGARLTHRVSRRRKGEWPLGELLLPDFPTLSTAAVAIGIPGPAQKITVQLMDDRGRTLGFAKYAGTPHARDHVANEARMLGLIGEDVGPRLVRFVRFLGGDLLVQTPLPGRVRMPRSKPDAAQVRLVERLVRAEEAYAASRHPFIEGLYARAGRRRSALEKIVADLEDSEWPAALHHGDLSPWNMRWQGSSCRAFDWEHGRESGLAYLEAAHAPIQVAGLIRKTDPLRAKRAVSGYVGYCLPPELGRFAPTIAALSALSTLVSWYPPRRPDAYERWLTSFVEAPP
jgi:hypothetical protein